MYIAEDHRRIRDHIPITNRIHAHSIKNLRGAMHLPKIKIENVTKIFGKKADKALELLEQKKSKQDILRATGATVGVNNVSLSIEEGEIFVIMGLSGSGKSTLVRMFNRLIERTRKPCAKSVGKK